MRFRGAKVLFTALCFFIIWLLRGMPGPMREPLGNRIIIVWYLLVVAGLTGIIIFEAAESWLETADPTFRRLSIVEMFTEGRFLMRRYAEARRARGLRPTLRYLDIGLRTATMAVLLGLLLWVMFGDPRR